MTESDVKVICQSYQIEYERETAGPRHDANLKKFDRIFKVLNRQAGAMWAIGILCGAPAFILGIMELVRAMKGQ
jgi:hypothetical protein